MQMKIWAAPLLAKRNYVASTTGNQ